MQTIGRYVVEGELGRGSSGVVYRARDPIIGRIVAIKCIRLDDFANPNERRKMRERLFREAQSAGILSHPGIVTVYDTQEETGSVYIFMEFVEGQTLEQVMLTPLASEYVQSLLQQAAAALDYAHSKGIIHRDIKPANLIVTSDGRLKITDFGVARMQSQQTTHTGSLTGTPNYMAPEQIQGKPCAPASDQFSLAVIAYELLTGQKPFSADSVPAVLYKIIEMHPITPRHWNPSLSAEVAHALGKALSKSPQERFRNCRMFIKALDGKWNAMMSEAQHSMPTMVVRPDGVKPVRRRSLGISRVVLSTLVVLAIIYGSIRFLGIRPEARIPVLDLPVVVTPAPAPPASTEGAAVPKPSPMDEPAAVPPPTPKPVPKAPEIASAGEYAVRIVTTPPGAKVLIDAGAPVCVSPCSLTLQTGRHTLSATLNGFTSAFKVFQLPDQTDLAITMDQPSGKLLVVTAPIGADIFIDGVLRPEKSPAQLTVPIGRHRIAVSVPGRGRREQDLEIRDGASTEFRVNW